MDRGRAQAPIGGRRGLFSGRSSVRLDANECNELGTLPSSQLLRCLREISWQRYPDPWAERLCEVISKRFHVALEDVIVGAGSTELIGILLCSVRQAVGRRTPTVVVPTPAFSMYAAGARAHSMKLVQIPLDSRWRLDVERAVKVFKRAAPDIVFLTTPHNPTGTVLSRKDLEVLVAAAPRAVVVVDEAYIDYGHSDHLEVYRSHPKVVILRTLSKVGFASLRVGWAFLSPAMRSQVAALQVPFSVSAASQALAIYALTKLAKKVAEAVRRVRRQRLAHGGTCILKGVEVTPSSANFVWLKTLIPAVKAKRKLESAGVFVKAFEGGSESAVLSSGKRWH